jgi:hypothetical protein
VSLFGYRHAGTTVPETTQIWGRGFPGSGNPLLGKPPFFPPLSPDQVQITQTASDYKTATYCARGIIMVVAEKGAEVAFFQQLGRIPSVRKRDARGKNTNEKACVSFVPGGDVNGIGECSQR